MFKATTTKDIISPITNTISQLITRNNEAEKNNAAIEDISEYSSLVVEQIQNFITNVILNIIGNQESDEKLKVEMYDGKLIVEKAAENLITSAKILKKDPYSKRGRSLLVKATNGILEGITSILNSYDDFNIRRIDHLCMDLINYYEKCRDNTEASKIVDNVKICSRYYIKLASLATQHITEFSSTILKKELQSAIDLLVKASPLLMSSCKTYLLYSKNEATANGFHNICNVLIHATEEIRRIVQINETDNTPIVKFGTLTEFINSMDTDEKDMIEAIKNKNVIAFNYAQASYDYKSKHFVKEASDIVYSVDDENERNKLQDLVESVRTSSNSVNAMGSKCALQKFDDDLSNTNLMNQIKYSTACAKYINGELNRQLMSSMARICHDISNRDYDITSFGNAYMKAIFREGHLQKEDLDRLIMNIDKLNEDYQTMNEMVSSEHDSSYTDNIERKIENVDRMKYVLLDALQAIIENPKESNLRKYLKSVTEVWSDQVKALKDSLVVEPGLFTTQELLNNTMGSFTKSIDKLTNESDKLSSDESKQLRKKAITSAKLFLDFAKYEMNNTKNEAYRMELIKNIEVVEKGFTINKIHSG